MLRDGVIAASRQDLLVEVIKISFGRHNDPGQVCVALLVLRVARARVVTQTATRRLLQLEYWPLLLAAQQDPRRPGADMILSAGLSMCSCCAVSVLAENLNVVALVHNSGVVVFGEAALLRQVFSVEGSGSFVSNFPLLAILWLKSVCARRQVLLVSGPSSALLLDMNSMEFFGRVVNYQRFLLACPMISAIPAAGAGVGTVGAFDVASAWT